MEWKTTRGKALKERKLTTMGNAHRMENNKAQSPERAASSQRWATPIEWETTRRKALKRRNIYSVIF